MLRKSGVILLTAMMVFLSACGSNKGNNAESSAPASSAPPSPSESASASPEASKEPVSIKILMYTPSGGQEETLKSMVDAFQAANTDVTVDAEVVPYADYRDEAEYVACGWQSAGYFRGWLREL